MIQSAIKILSYPAAVALAKVLMSGCFKLVITNGCFDLLHVGHVRYLEAARALGDQLMVGVNVDWAVKALKGPGRPVNTTPDRMTVLAALNCVSYVVPIDSIRVDEFIQGMKAAVWAKGGYTLETLDKSEVAAAQSAGTEIKLLDNVRGYSTTGILEKLGRE